MASRDNRKRVCHLGRHIHSMLAACRGRAPKNLEKGPVVDFLEILGRRTRLLMLDFQVIGKDVVAEVIFGIAPDRVDVVAVVLDIGYFY